MTEPSTDSCTVWFNPSCSKCRGARDLLAERGVDATYVRYLDDTPSADEIERVLGLLGFDDPRDMMRRGEPPFTELQLAELDAAAEDDRRRLVEAMVQHPILIERPIVIVGDRAVIARPPERLDELLSPEA